MSQKKQNQPSRSRKWQITINNPQDKGFTHEKLKTMFKSFPSLIYWCMADEIGLENNQYHTHAYVCLKNPMRFETLQNKFDKQAHLENAVGSSQENRDYIFKQGKWADSPKADTQVNGTQEEGGKLPADTTIKIDDNKKFYGTLYKLIEDGYTDGEIIAKNPNYIPLINKFSTIRNAIRTKEFSYTRRDKIEVVYIWGAYRWNKIKEIRDTYGDENVYSIADYNQPFEDYDCQDVIILEEFFNDIPFRQLMHYLQEYPVKLSARYSNKVSCFTKVYIVSEFPLQDQFQNCQYADNMLYKDFLDKIQEVIYCNEEHSFQSLAVNEIVDEIGELPFD